MMCYDFIFWNVFFIEFGIFSLFLSSEFISSSFDFILFLYICIAGKKERKDKTLKLED